MSAQATPIATGEEERYRRKTAASGRFFVEARRSGLLELLLGTPLTERQVVHGQLRALLRLFGWPLAVCLGLYLVGAGFAQRSAVSTASTRATPAASVRSFVARARATSGTRPGLSTTETYRPQPGGENHSCPRRPRPAVCESAITMAPSLAAAQLLARAAATSLVDPVTGKYMMREPRRPRRGRAEASASASSSGNGADP